MAHLLSVKAEGVIESAARKLGFPVFGAVLKRLEWLGLFSDEVLPADASDPLAYLNVVMLRQPSMQPNDPRHGDHAP